MSGKESHPAFDPAVSEVYYPGTKTKFGKITFYGKNSSYGYLLSSARIHYNYNWDEKVSSIFDDIADGKWYSNEILYVYKAGAMKGKSVGCFDPLANVQMSEAAAMIYQLEGSPEITKKKKIYADVSTGSWCYNATAWCRNEKILLGRNVGDELYFYPKNLISRQDFMVVLYKYASWKGYDLSVRSDYSYRKADDSYYVSKYAEKAVNWGYENGIIGNGSSINPKGNITRREVAVMLARFFRVIGI